MSLQEEIQSRAREMKDENRAYREKNRAEALAKVEASFRYVFGEAPESVSFAGGYATAHADGLCFVATYEGGSEVLCVLRKCPECQEDFILKQSVGASKNNYGARYEQTQEERRKRAISALATLQNNGFKPSRGEHGCYGQSLRRVREMAEQVARKRGMTTEAVLDAASLLQ